MARKGEKTGRKLGGRKKGTVNKISASIKTQTLEALAKAGGAEYLTDQAVKNPTAFLGLLGKILPQQLQIEAQVTTKEFVINMIGLDPDPPKLEKLVQEPLITMSTETPSEAAHEQVV